jgi:hypothetical protein
VLASTLNDEVIIMAKPKPAPTVGDAPPETAVFSRAQLLRAARYQGQRDLLSALLDEDKVYTHEDVAILLNKFLNGGNS